MGAAPPPLARNLTILKWLSIDDLLLGAAIAIAFEMGVVGLSFTQVLLGESIFAFTILLFEIPTGIFSDMVSRKWTLVLHEFFLLFGVISLAFAQSFAHVILAQILWAVGVALRSGTDSAMLYDTLLSLRQEGEHRSIYGHIESFSLRMLAIGFIVSGLIAAQWGLRFPMMLSIVIPAAKLALSFILIEPGRTVSDSPHRKPVHLMLSSFRWIATHRAILLFVLAGMLFSIGWKMTTQTFNPFLELTGTPVAFWGILMAFFSLLSSFIAKESHRIQSSIGGGSSLLLIIALQAGGFFLLTMPKAPAAFLFLLPLFIINPFRMVFLSDELNKRASSHQRATVLSVASFSGQLLQMLTLPFLGLFADRLGLTALSLFLAGAIALPGLLLFLGLHRSFLNERRGNGRTSCSFSP